jgi:hypothetical protein
VPAAGVALRIDVLWGMSPVAGDGTFLRTRIPRVALGCTLDTEVDRVHDH